MKKLKRSFYTRDLLEVARELPGKLLVKRESGTLLAGRIVEVEAYDGDTDKAAHSYNGPTPRNRIMFEKGGLFYVYFTYGTYYCCNVITGEKGRGTGVLLRGIEAVEGINEMALNRFGKKELTKKEKLNLTSGPGKICMAFDIDKRYYGADLTGDTVFLAEGDKVDKSELVETTRIGIRKSTELPWRFYIKDNPFVSKK